MTMRKRLRPIGKVVEVVGLEGDIKVFPLVLDFESLAGGGGLYVGSKRSSAKDIDVTPVAKTGNLFRYRVQGVSSQEESRNLVGQFIFVSLEAGQFLPEEILGFRVLSTEGEGIGELVDVLHLPASDVYVIDCEGREVLIPAVDEIVRKIDVDAGEIIIFPMEGLIET